MMATGVPTGMSFVLASIRIFAIKPSSWFSKARVALSVSISARTVPGEISSPSLTYHRMILPWVIVGDSDGMCISCGRI
jgi:hypothetical protein